MNTMQLINLEKLEEVSFQRSKEWANLINKFTSQPEGPYYSLNDLETFLPREDHKNESSSEEAEEVVLTSDDEDLIKSIMIPSGAGALNDMSKIDAAAYKDAAEMQDLFNQTIPVVMEHERKWKEAGIERILNTFDEEKIELEVGDWMRRHHKNADAANKKQQHKHVIESNTDNDTDSLHSMDTALYIRNSRNCCSAQVKRTSCTAKRNIKNYRLLQSKREALREKYACNDEDDDDVQHLLQRYATCHAHKSKHHSAALASYASTTKFSMRRKSYRKRRHLNSSRGDTTTTTTSSSDDESSAPCLQRNFKQLHDVWRDKQLQKRQRRSHKKSMTINGGRGHKRKIIYCYSSSSASLHNLSNSFNKLRTPKSRAHAPTKYAVTDVRPARREKDCCCYDAQQLCKNVRHFANSSTENWQVDSTDCTPNKCSKTLPTAKLKQSAAQLKIMQTVKAPKKRKLLVQEKLEEELDNVLNSNTQKRSKILKKEEAQSLKMLKKQEAQSLKILKKEEAQAKSLKTKKVLKAQHKKAEKKVATKPLKKACENKKDKEQIVAQEDDVAAAVEESEEDEDFINQLEKAIKLSKETLKAEKKLKNKENKDKQTKKSKKSANKKKVEKAAVDNDNDDDDFFDFKRPKQQKQKLRKEPTILTTTEDTFYTNPKNLYNSTALHNDSAARKRQFFDAASTAIKRKTITTSERFAATATKTESATATKAAYIKPLDESENERDCNTNTEDNITNNSLSATIIPAAAAEAAVATTSAAATKASNNDNNNDCTLVTSTTVDAVMLPLKENQQQPNQQQNRKHIFQQLQQQLQQQQSPTKGILLYAPNQRNSLPEQFFSNNGCIVHIKESHLANIIGLDAARKFLKFYIGRRCFDANSTIYYRPPAQSSVDSETHTDSDDDDDVFDNADRYGDLYESFAKQ